MAAFAKKLMKFGVLLPEYSQALIKPEINL